MPKLTFLDSGKTYDVPAGASFLTVAQEHGEHSFGCTVGSCGTCRLEVVEGADQVNPQSDDERETVEMSTDVAGARLGCQLRIQGDVSVRAVD